MDRLAGTAARRAGDALRHQRGDLFLAGGAGAHFDGSIWRLLYLGDALGVWASGSDDVYFVGSGQVAHCASAPCDDASRFAITPVGAVLYALWGAAPDDVVAVGGDGVVLEYDGSGWIEVRHGGPLLRGVGGRSSEEVFAVGEGGTILARTPGGWVPAAADLRSSDMIRCPGLSAVVRVGDDLVVVGGDGAILRLPPRP
ncbi:MAG: hypothetical protein M5U28_33340 [Sandaracinaceae bacterium]|nr:hypothetical protein [Sandaracinaceae bacterium]